MENAQISYLVKAKLGCHTKCHDATLRPRSRQYRMRMTQSLHENTALRPNRKAIHKLVRTTQHFNPTSEHIASDPHASRNVYISGDPTQNREIRLPKRVYIGSLPDRCKVATLGGL